MSKDISNQTVIVLAVLAILVSILGVATIFFETSKVNTTPDIQGTTQSSGTIRLEIAQPSKEVTSGSISLNIDRGDT